MSLRRLPGVVLCVTGAVIASRFATAADTPLDEKAIVTLVELKIDDDAVIARIKKAGVAFTPDDAALKRLAGAGASEAVVRAVREAGSANKPATGSAAIQYEDVLKLLTRGLDEDAILKRLARSPTVFTLSAAQVAELKKAGASETLLSAMQGVRPSSPQAAELVTDFAIVLDCSGSMREPTTGGEAKMVAAKRVVTDLVRNIPEGMNVTFVIYGHEVFGGADDPRNCQAVKVARPLSPLDAAGKSELSRLITGLTPVGTTPIALSLRVAGEELQKNQAYCGLVLITDGVETCKGDPVAEAARLAANPKLTFGVNVVGFGTKKEEDKALAEIAKAGRGKYYRAESARDLGAALGTLAKELDKVAAKPKTSTSARRAVKVLKPEIEFPPYAEIRVITRGLGSIAVVAKGKYGEEIRLPSGTDKYEIQWVPKAGHPVAMLKDFTLVERKVIEVKPEEYLGMVKVSGKGTPKTGIRVYQRGLGSIIVLQECKKYGEVMVVPAVKVNVDVDDNVMEEGLVVKPGTLHELE